VTHQLNTDHDHSKEPEHTDFKWALSAELNGETRRKNKIAGVSEDNSGGTTIYLSPGIRLSAGKLSGFVSYGVPITENQHGKQTDVDNRVVAGVSLAF